MGLSRSYAARGLEHRNRVPSHRQLYRSWRPLLTTLAAFAFPICQRRYVAFLFFVLLGVVSYVGSAVGFGELVGSVSTSPLAALVRAYLDGDIACAIGAFVGAPLFLFYLCLSYLNQRMRVLYAWYIGSSLPDGEERLIFTALATRQLRTLAEWDWALVLLKMDLLSLIVWMLLYGSTLTYMGLAALVEWLRTVSCG